MKMLEQKIRARVLDWGELTDLERRLLIGAAQARPNAYAPYSRYKVGAALHSSAGNIYLGVNAETATYEATHGETSAIASMITDEGPLGKAGMLAGVSGPEEEEIILPPKEKIREPLIFSLDDLLFPCGSCRQRIWENCFGDPGVAIVWRTRWGGFAKTTIGDLLPARFGPENLGVDYQKA